MTEDRYEVEPIVPGASLSSRIMNRDQLPESILFAMIVLRMDGVGVQSQGVGVMVADGIWELDDECLHAPSR